MPCYNSVAICVLSCLVAIQVSCDSGSMTSCGGSDFSISWTPRVLIAGKMNKFHVSGKTNMGFETGSVHSTVWQGTTPDPVWDNKQSVTCEELAKDSPIKLDCPVKQGYEVNVTSEYAMPDILSVLPPDDYKVKATVTNPAGDVFVCLQGTMTIQSP